VDYLWREEQHKGVRKEGSSKQAGFGNFYTVLSLWWYGGWSDESKGVQLMSTSEEGWE
jgi:hypothetical protein